MKKNKNVSQWMSLLLLGICLILVYKMLDSLSAIRTLISNTIGILTPFVVGFVIAFLLYAPQKKIETCMRKSRWRFIARISRGVSVFTVYLFLLAIVALIFYLIIPALSAAVIDFVNNVPEYYDNAMTFVKKYSEPGGLLENLDVEQRIQDVYQLIKNQLTAEHIFSYVKSVVSWTSSIVDIIMALIVSVYMLIGRESLLHALRAVFGLFIKPKTMNFYTVYLHKTSKIFYNYVYSALLDALVVSILATIGFLLARLPNAPALGIMLGLMNLVPYFGALIGGVISVLAALLSGNFYGALFVAIYILVMQQIDGNIIQPRIVGQGVGLKAIYVLLGITIGGGLFGFWGILLGAPFMAVVQMLITDYIAYRKTQKSGSTLMPGEQTPEE